MTEFRVGDRVEALICDYIVDPNNDPCDLGTIWVKTVIIAIMGKRPLYVVQYNDRKTTVAREDLRHLSDW